MYPPPSTPATNGGEGNDDICGGWGSDELYGGDGADTVFGGPDDDVANDGEGSIGDNCESNDTTATTAGCEATTQDHCEF